MEVPKVLVFVHDIPYTVAVIDLAFRKVGYEIAIACNHDEALDALNEKGYFLLVTDPVMLTGRESDFEVEVRNRSPDTILLVLTGTHKPSLDELSFDQLADDYLSIVSEQSEGIAQ